MRGGLTGGGTSAFDDYDATAMPKQDRRGRRRRTRKQWKKKQWEEQQ
jgi:hypothetical protein